MQDLGRRMNRQGKHSENVCQSPNKGLLPKIYEKYSKLNIQNKQSHEKMGRDLKRHLTEEHTQMASKLCEKK